MNNMKFEKCHSCVIHSQRKEGDEQCITDYFRKFTIKYSSIYIFPTILGNGKSFGYWTEEFDLPECIKNNQHSMFGFTVDAIVNSANNKLIPGSGLAKYLRSKLTSGYTVGCAELLKNNNLKRGQSYFISLPKQYRITSGVLEAITVEYYNTGNGLSRILSNARIVYDCIYSSLEMCDKLGLKSIALPQMVSRIGYSIFRENPSKKMITSTYLAINDYLNSVNSEINEIYIHPSNLESEELLYTLFDNK